MENSSNATFQADGLALIGFRINPDNDNPEVYTLIVHGDRDFPIIVNGQILFFSKPELVLRAFELSDANVKQFGPPPQDTSLICDIAEMLDLIKNADLDTSAAILNCLNTMFDLVQATGTLMPDEYKVILYEFADHLTFEQEFASYILQKNIQRNTIIDAILWCIGAIVAKAKLLTE